jgi:hypothetical protein
MQSLSQPPTGRQEACRKRPALVTLAGGPPACPPCRRTGPAKRTGRPVYGQDQRRLLHGRSGGAAGATRHGLGPDQVRHGPRRRQRASGRRRRRAGRAAERCQAPRGRDGTPRAWAGVAPGRCGQQCRRGARRTRGRRRAPCGTIRPALGTARGGSWGGHTAASPAPDWGARGDKSSPPRAAAGDLAGCLGRRGVGPGGGGGTACPSPAPPRHRPCGASVGQGPSGWADGHGHTSSPGRRGGRGLAPPGCRMASPGEATQPCTRGGAGALLARAEARAEPARGPGCSAPPSHGRAVHRSSLVDSGGVALPRLGGLRSSQDTTNDNCVSTNRIFELQIRTLK